MTEKGRYTSLPSICSRVKCVNYSTKFMNHCKALDDVRPFGECRFYKDYETKLRQELKLIERRMEKEKK